MVSTAITAPCSTCGQEFTLTAEVQADYQRRGFVLPQRCASCRDARRVIRQRGPRTVPCATCQRPVTIAVDQLLRMFDKGRRLGNVRCLACLPKPGPDPGRENERAAGVAEAEDFLRGDR